MTREEFINALLEFASKEQEKDEQTIREQAKHFGELLKKAQLGLQDAGYTEDESFKLLFFITRR